MNKVTVAQYVEILKREYPDAKCSLDFKTPLQLAVATILSAQSTDLRVNMTTPELFKKFRSVDDFADAGQSELENAIKTIGLYRAKAKNIIAFAKKLRSDFGGKLPDTIDELQKLPGVGRKTANVIQGVLHGDGKAEGIAVDTHVTRLSYRLGLTKETDPKKIERDLQKWFAKGDWVLISHLLILHGRAVCNARKPMCGECALEEICPKRGVSVAK
ncbi:MAG: endonuclease III [Candidatus Zixiibacteriota bacterium]